LTARTAQAQISVNSNWGYRNLRGHWKAEMKNSNSGFDQGELAGMTPAGTSRFRCEILELMIATTAHTEV
jgi:hypothetical protein